MSAAHTRPDRLSDTGEPPLRRSGGCRTFRGNYVTCGFTVFVFFLTGTMLSCTPPPFTFSFSESYSRDKFSGQNVSGHVIGICPLLTSHGAVSRQKLPSRDMAAVFRKSRADLPLVEADSLVAVLSKTFADSVLATYFRLLFNGDIVTLQTADSLWKAMPSDFLFVVCLRHGMDVRTFNHLMRKRISLEVSLWDRKAMETSDGAWRRCSRRAHVKAHVPRSSLGAIARH